MHADNHLPFTSRFISACRDYPLRPAMVIHGTTYTYSELLGYVKALMKLLNAETQGHSVIAVADRNDVYTYASIIALNLLGKTYVPVNLSNPSERTRMYFEETGIKTILSSSPERYDKIRWMSSKINSLSDNLNEPISFSSSASPAYIMFTSGSTGTPKGVPIYNQHLNTFFNFFMDGKSYPVSPDDRFLQVYEAGFDVSVFSTFLPLFNGACTCLLPRKKPLFLEIPEFMLKENITVVSMVPSTLNYLKPYFPELRFEKLRYSFFSGDKLYHSLTREWSRCVPNARIINCYGPTETTIVCSHYEWNSLHAEKESLHDIVPLGKLFDGMHYLILDEKTGNPATEGELCIAGPQVINSYLHNIQQELFFDSGAEGKKINYYRSGDRVKISDKGNLQFLGRSDSQVKINGYRVELSEIEFHLSRMTGSSCNAVVPVKNGSELLSLCAFIEGTGDPEDIEVKLRAALPSYSIPKQISFLSKIPLTSTGKIDRMELLKFVVRENPEN